MDDKRIIFWIERLVLANEIINYNNAQVRKTCARMRRLAREGLSAWYWLKKFLITITHNSANLRERGYFFLFAISAIFTSLIAYKMKKTLFADRIKELRKRKWLSQAELA